MSKLSLTLHTFSITGSGAGLFLTPYYKHIELENNKPEDDIREPIDSSQLFYKDNMDKSESISKMADTFPTDRKQCISNVAPAPKMAPQLGSRDISKNSSNCYKLKTLELVKRVNLVLG